MAFASSIQKGQIPVGCQLCEGGNKIKWKCNTCESLMCDKCKEGVHLKIGKDHKILNINEIGKRKDTNIFRGVKCEEYTTDLIDIHFIAVCSDGSMWMADNARSKLQHVKLRGNKIQVKTSLNTKIYGIAKTHSNNILITTGETKLKLINTVTEEITDSRYEIKLLLPTSIHVTSDHRVIIGAKSPGEPFPATGKRVVIVLDQEGKQLKEYEHDNHKKQLFGLMRFLTITSTKRLLTYPLCVTCTSNGNICVVDKLDEDGRGRVVVLSPGGDILGTYTGHPDVNTEEKSFKPKGILTTPSDNIFVTDRDNHLLHILSDQGQSITYYNLRAMGILRPYALALSTTGTILIGCLSERGSPVTTKAKLFNLNFSGF